MKKPVINNFAPDYKMANSIVKRRLKIWLIISLIIALLEVITLSLLDYFKFWQVTQILGIILIAVQLVSTLTYLMIFDNGAANNLRKKNFIVTKTKLAHGHTYYYALKKSGFIRVGLNLVFVSILILTLTLCLVI